MKHLFRAKLKDRFNYSEWEFIYPDKFKDGYVYGQLIECKNKSFICISLVGANNRTLVNNTIATMVEVIPESICEYTGVQDKNKVKIFENDYVSTEYGRIYKVVRLHSHGYNSFNLNHIKCEPAIPDVYDIRAIKNLEVVDINSISNPDAL